MIMRFDDRHEVVITGPWVEEMADAVRSGVADRVVCNYALGFDEPDLRFLDHLPVRELIVLDPRIDDLGPVYSLAPVLERLDLTVDPHTTVDLRELPNLTRLSADWSQVADTIGAVGGLRRVALARYRPDDLTPLTGLPALESVSLRDRPSIRSLAGLGQLPEIVQLGVFGAAKLDDVADLRQRERIEMLYLEACPGLHTTEDLNGCAALRKLSLAEGSEFDTSAPLGALTMLEELYLYDTTRFADGDLSPIAELPRLEELRMQNRRHYRPTVKAIQAAIAERHR